jgi:AmiR/NasT family two-component response regulator
LMALGAFATLTAELVRTGAELVSRDLAMAQLRQALTSWIWIEQAKGVLAASQEVTPDEGFQQLRTRARTRLAQRTAALDRAQDVLAGRERAAGRND